MGLNFVANLKHSLPTNPNFTGNFGTGVAFADPTQQQNRLNRTKVPPFKDGPAIKIVNTLTPNTAVNCQVAGLGLPKLTGLVQACSTMGTLQPVRVKVFEQPLVAKLII
jgi:hypothetical protein